ncbi:MAG: cupin domain-containing protein [Ruminococcaceae bacterium]|nr:cupin domain-containing protein [Oscillospiraceae bacterium]
MKLTRINKIIEKRFGGKGHLISDSILGTEQMSGGCRMYSEITLEKGCSLGIHKHEGETETYFIIEGKGLYYDNGESYNVAAGDVLFCDNGESHGMENNGDEKLKFIALILEK